MKPVLRLSVVLATVALVGLVLSACEGDRGPAGPAGTTECMNCHSDDFGMANFLLPIQTQYSYSKHATGDTYLRTGSSCSRCHTNEGFQYYVANGTGTEIANSSQIGCFTCHAPHSNGDFGLRATGPVMLELSGTYDRGNSNLCANCHQARSPSPAIADGTEADGRWGTHHGPQANVVSAQGAYEFDGPYPMGPSHNLVEDGCVTCHMGPQSADIGGGHTFAVLTEEDEVNLDACFSCHDAWEEDDDLGFDEIEALQTAFEADLQALMTAMGPAGLNWFDTDDLSEAGGRILNEAVYSADNLGAIWNFRMLAEDRSLGVHNTVYARAVLDATLDYVNSL